MEIEIPLRNIHNEIFIEEIINSLDLIMGSMGATRENYIFQNENILDCFFKTSNRKRNGQLNKFAKRNLEKLKVDFNTQGLTKIIYDEKITKLKLNKNSKIIEQPEKLLDYLNYDGNDLHIFKDPNNWYSWQKTNIYY